MAHLLGKVPVVGYVHLRYQTSFQPRDAVYAAHRVDGQSCCLQNGGGCGDGETARTREHDQCGPPQEAVHLDWEPLVPTRNSCFLGLNPNTHHRFTRFGYSHPVI